MTSTLQRRECQRSIATSGGRRRTVCSPARSTMSHPREGRPQSVWQRCRAVSSRPQQPSGRSTLHRTRRTSPARRPSTLKPSGEINSIFDMLFSLQPPSTTGALHSEGSGQTIASDFSIFQCKYHVCVSVRHDLEKPVAGKTRSRQWSTNKCNRRTPHSSRGWSSYAL